MPFRVFVYSPRKAKGENTKHVFLSLFQLSTFGTKTRNFLCLKFRVGGVEIFRVVALCLSCLRIFASKCKGRSNDKRHVFVSSPFAFRGEDTKTRNGINQPP